MDKGRRKGEKTGGDRQLRKGDRGRREGAEESGRRMEAEISQGRPRHSRRCKMRHRNPREGTKIRKLGPKFKFDQLIIRKIIKIVATMSYFKAKMHQISTPFPVGEAHSAFPDPVAGFKCPASQGSKRGEGKRGRGGERNWRGKGREGGA